AGAAGLREPVRFARIGQGQSNLTFLATDARGRRLVLRRPPLGHLLASAHDVAREHRILRALGATTVPAPGVVAFTDDPAITDVPLLAMEHVDGLVVDDLTVAEGLPGAVRGRLGLALPRALATVHAVDLEATGLIDLASHKPYAARQLKRWRRQWEDSRTRELPAVTELADRLEAAMPEQRELTLVHGDFHLLNVIAAPDGAAVRAILDWELCTLGDPLADLGGLLAYWPQASDLGTPVFPAPKLPGFPSRAALARAYADASGRDVGSALAFWHALGLWKIAVIVEGVRRRAIDDPRNAPPAGAPPQETVDDLVAQARLVAFEAGF
ncbi:MAG TPA: phosphotransferase family protein, partial [Baekduia sp.]|nr:phosphotransferase family protein [Baekduia sp.]